MSITQHYVAHCEQCQKAEETVGLTYPENWWAVGLTKSAYVRDGAVRYATLCSVECVAQFLMKCMRDNTSAKRIDPLKAFASALNKESEKVIADLTARELSGEISDVV